MVPKLIVAQFPTFGGDHLLFVLGVKSIKYCQERLFPPSDSQPHWCDTHSSALLHVFVKTANSKPWGGAGCCCGVDCTVTLQESNIVHIRVMHVLLTGTH